MKLLYGNKVRKKINFSLTYVIIISMSLWFLYPFYYLIANSLRDILNGIPTPYINAFHWENYYFAIDLVPFMLWVWNTIILVLISMGFSVVMNFMFGFAFARLEAPGKKFWFAVMLSQLMIPSIAVSIPQYILYGQIGIKGTYWLWVLNGLAGNAFFTFLYRQYFLTIPKEIEEAAIIDGANILQVIYKIFLPISKPVVAVVIFLDFQGVWNDFMTPYMYLPENKWPLSMALMGVKYYVPQRPELKLDPVVLAAAVLLTIPVILAFFACQKHLVQGMTAGSIKG